MVSLGPTLQHFRWWIVLTIISLLAILWLQAPRLFDEFRVDEDFRQFYWMNKFQDPLLFPQPTTDYTVLDLFGYDLPVTFYSLGYGLLFYGASFLVTPVFFSKILPFFVMPITLWYLFEFGQFVRNQRMGIVLALGFLLVNLVSSSSISITNGLQRSLALSLVIALIYYLYRQRYVAAGLVIVVSALCYAPAFALGVVSWGLLILKKGGWPSRLNLMIQRGLVQLLIAFSLGVLVLSPIVFPSLVDVFVENPASVSSHSGAITAETYLFLWEDPIYGTGGPVQMFVIFPIIGRGGLVDLGEDMVNLLILSSLGALSYLVLGRRTFRLPAEIWAILWAGLILFVVAWLPLLLANSFLFYVPSRYTRVGVFLFLFMLVSLNSSAFIDETPFFLQRNFQKLSWLIAVIELVVLAVIIFYPSELTQIGGFNLKWLLAGAGITFGVLGVAIIKRKSQFAQDRAGKNKTLIQRSLGFVALILFGLGWAAYAPIFTETSYLNPPSAERKLLKFLETLPKPSLIGGTPCLLDSVPLFASRQIPFSCEAYGEDSVLIRNALAAYYADNWPQVAEFCQDYQIDYLVIDQKTYTSEFLTNERVFFEPYNGELLAYLGDRKKFVLSQTPDEMKIFQADGFFVIPLANIELMAKQVSLLPPNYSN